MMVRVCPLVQGFLSVTKQLRRWAEEDDVEETRMAGDRDERNERCGALLCVEELDAEIVSAPAK